MQQYAVMFKAKDALNCDQQVFGPFASYIEAEDFLCTLPVALYCDWKYVIPMAMPGITEVHSQEWIAKDNERIEALYI